MTSHRSAKRRCHGKLSCNSSSEDSNSSSLPLGTFSSGTSIFRNRLSESELWQDGHVSLENLVLPNTCAAFCTAMTVNDQWIQDCLGGLTKVICVHHDPQYGRKLGNAQLLRRNDDWYRIGINPSSGLMHAKLLLFRSVEGLRVVVAGSNLYRQQWEVDRDCLWVQDFLPGPGHQHGAGPAAENQFEMDLREFAGNLTECQHSSDQALVTARMDQVLNGIDFSPAVARLVVSFPGNTSSKKKVGWKQLAASVRSLLANKPLPKEHHAAPLYAMAGSFGDLKPHFLFQMKRAMRGQEEYCSDINLSWDHLEYLKIHCLWPSLENAQSMHLPSFAHCRPMAREHWETVPESTRRLLFFDAPPNPSKTALGNAHPVSHAKVMFQTHGNMAVLYVGSHNLSVAAWGLGNGRQANNVELGVVLTTETQSEQWKERLPCKLPTEATSASSMIPATLYLAREQAQRENDANDPKFQKMLADSLHPLASSPPAYRARRQVPLSVSPEPTPRTVQEVIDLTKDSDVKPKTSPRHHDIIQRICGS